MFASTNALNSVGTLSVSTPLRLSLPAHAPPTPAGDRRRRTATPARRKWLHLAALPLLAGLAIGLPTRAEAIALAYSLNDVTDLTVTSLFGSLTFGRPTTESLSDADLDSVEGRSFSRAPLDARPTCEGRCPQPNNVFEVTAPHLAHGDALIQIPAGQPVPRVRAVNEALVNLSKRDSGTAAGTNRLITPFMLSGPDTLGLSFMADPLLEAELRAPHVVGSSVDAILLFLVDIDRLAAGGPTNIFHWEPDGIARNATGRADILDPFSLNKGIGLIETPGRRVEDLGPGLFRAQVPLDPGQYRLTIVMQERALAQIPEPATILLFGTGLVLLLTRGLRHSRMFSR